MFHFVTELEPKTPKGFDKEPSYYVRLGSISTKLRKRAYTRAVAKIQDGKQRSMEFISELNNTVDKVGLLIANNNSSTVREISKNKCLFLLDSAWQEEYWWHQPDSKQLFGVMEVQ